MIVDEQRLEECIRLGLDPSPDRNSKLIPLGLDDLPTWLHQNSEWIHKNRLSRLDWQ